MDETPWRLISQVNSNTIFDKVKVGDEVAISQEDEDGWWLGIVLEIGHYAGRSTRFQERPVLTVDCYSPVKRVRVFYEECVDQILFKDELR